MVFNSFEFLLFFPIVTILFFLLPHKLRWLHLLVASCIFYMAFVPVYILILAATIVIDYFAGILIENAPEHRKRAFLVMSIIANVGVLVFFKYFNFLADNFNSAFSFFHVNAHVPLLKILLPIGLSFHTFQAMSYTIEVYRGNEKAERHFGIYALYVMFYPQLVAGPIERPQNLLYQFHSRQSFKYDDVVSGLRLMAWGLIKKAVVADRLAIVVDQFYSDPTQSSGIGLALGLVFFVFQVYCDFSGYSDIAIGAARVMGFKLMINFNRPFISKSATEYWKRWHISLATWFYDYVFNPVVMSLRTWGRKAIGFGLFLTFFLSGIWHGAGWNYVLWGIVWSIAIVFEFYTKNFRIKLFGYLPKWLNSTLSIIITFSFCCFAAIFFRVPDFSTEMFVIKKILQAPGEVLQVINTRKMAFLNLPGLYNVLLPALLVICSLEIAQLMRAKYGFGETIGEKPKAVRWSIYYLGMILLFFFGVYDNRQFIYFQF